MRVYSGFLVPKEDHRKEGSATISFHPYGVTGDATLERKRSVGGTGHFARKPCASFALQEFSFYDSTGSGHGGVTSLNIDYSTLSTSLVEVTWSGKAAGIHKISFMIVGEPG